MHWYNFIQFQRNPIIRTLLSSKIGTSRWMIPYDGFCNPLPLNPYTIMRGFSSIDKHPDRTHEHISYKISNMEDPSNPPVNAAAINKEELKAYDDSNMENPSAPPIKTAAIDEGELKVNHGILVSGDLILYITKNFKFTHLLTYLEDADEGKFQAVSDSTGLAQFIIGLFHIHLSMSKKSSQAIEN